MKKRAISILGILFFLLILGLIILSCSAQEAVHIILSGAEDDAQVIIRGQTSDNTFRVPHIDSITHTLQTIEYEHHAIHAGESFTYCGVIDIENSGSRMLLIVTPNTTSRVHMVWNIAHELEASVEFYEGVTYSHNGDSLIPYNRDRNSINTAKVLLSKMPTIISYGIKIYETQQGAGKKSGGVERSTNEYILKSNTSYLIRIINRTTNNNVMTIKLDWYEHIDRSP